MNKIYALVDISGVIHNTILLDIDTSTWTCPPDLVLQETDIGIGNNILAVLQDRGDVVQVYAVKDKIDAQLKTTTTTTVTSTVSVTPVTVSDPTIITKPGNSDKPIK